MYGPEILVASMTVPQPRGPSRQLWQYHSRSDVHSKVASRICAGERLQGREACEVTLR